MSNAVPAPRVVTCESSAAISLHARWLTTTTPAVSLSGHRHPFPSAMCGAAIRWDTRVPINGTTCPKCIQSLRLHGFLEYVAPPLVKP